MPPLPPTTGLPRWPTFPDGEAERLRRLDVEDQLDSCSLLDRQIGWFLVFENAPGIDILGSPHNPKFLWVDDAEIVGDRITEVRPAPGNFFT